MKMNSYRVDILRNLANMFEMIDNLTENEETEKRLDDFFDNVDDGTWNHFVDEIGKLTATAQEVENVMKQMKFDEAVGC